MKPGVIAPAARSLGLGLFARTAVLVATFVACAPASASSEPPLPMAPPPVGVPVAILGPGIDYRLPEIAARLARDGEGDLIAWDFRDGDGRPFSAADDPQAGTGDATPFARALLAANPALTLVIIREPPGDPQAFGHMMSFAARTPARIVVWPAAHPARPDWPILLEAVNHFTGHLFILPAPPAGTDEALVRQLDAAANAVLAPPRPAGNSEAADALAAAVAAAADALAAAEPPPVASIAAEIRHWMAAAHAEPAAAGKPR